MPACSRPHARAHAHTAHPPACPGAAPALCMAASASTSTASSSTTTSCTPCSTSGVRSYSQNLALANNGLLKKGPGGRSSVGSCMPASPCPCASPLHAACIATHTPCRCCCGPGERRGGHGVRRQRLRGLVRDQPAGVQGLAGGGAVPQRGERGAAHQADGGPGAGGARAEWAGRPGGRACRACRACQHRAARQQHTHAPARRL